MPVLLTDPNDRLGVISFILLSFGMAWTLWLGGYYLGLELTSPMFSVLNIVAVFTPALSAFIVRRYITKEGFSDIGFKIRLVSWRYFLLAWLMPLFIIATVAYCSNVLGLTEINFSMQQAVAQSSANAQPLPSTELFIVSIMVGAIFSSLILFGEEFGWRGYLQKKLCWQSPWKSAMLTGVIWGVWHYPLNLQGYNFPEHRYLGLVVFPIACIFLSYIFAWFYRRTASIWGACLAHSSFNSIAGSLMVILYVNKTNYIMTSIVGILGTILLAFIAILMHFYDLKYSKNDVVAVSI